LDRTHGVPVAFVEDGGIVAMRRVLGICGLIGLSVLPSDSGQSVTLAVSPAHAFAPATVRIRARIEPDADNRLLTIVADGSNFYRSSDVQLDGDRAPKTIELWFRDVPGGEYELYAVVSDALGRRRTSAHSSVTVLSPFDGQ
jgi:hypothetical protein